MKGRLITPFLIAISLLVALLGLLHTPVMSETDAPICVNTTGLGGCYTSIQVAIDAATEHDRINVDVGTYNEHITLTKNLELIGKGWDTTVIDGGYIISHAVVTIQSHGIDASTVISGFQITGGGLRAPSMNHGGGINIEYASPKIINTWVFSCTGEYGGGIYVNYGSPSFENVPVWNSRATEYGGGYFIVGTGHISILGDPMAGITNGTIWWNHADHEGGGIGVIEAALTLAGTRIYWNTAGQLGGGVLIENNSNFVELSFNDIAGNSAQNGGGIHTYNATNLHIGGNLIWGNHTTSGDGGGVFLNASSGRFEFNNVHHNKAGASGGGVYLFNSPMNLTAYANRIEANQANKGGGIAVSYHATPLIDANTIVSNTSLTGGGLDIDDTEVFSITNNIIARNVVTGSNLGSGILINVASPYLLNNTIADNNGDGITYNGTPDLRIYNNIIAFNWGTGINWLNSPGITPTVVQIDYNDVYNNSASEYSANVTHGTHERHENPGFKTFGDIFNFYHIFDFSLIKSNGNLSYSPKFDINGQNRWLNGTVSIGADEIEYEVFLPVTMRLNP